MTDKKINEILLIGILTGLILFMFRGSAIPAWNPIIGIPEPPFGINETAPATPSPWTTDVAGFYYVCESCPGATDSGRTYGNPSVPRRTIPSTLPAGSVVELHGTYTTRMDPFQINGTVSNPVFIRGVDYANRPLIKVGWYPKGTYYIIENVHFTDFGDGATAGKLYFLAPSDHVVLRDSEADGNANAGGLGVLSWDNNIISYAVINNTKIHHNGDVNANYDQDLHGIAVSKNAHHVWLVNNEMYANSGDGIQINAGDLLNMATTHHIYVGKNVSHGNKQSGMWTKQAADVIFSQNTIYNVRPSGSSLGGAATGFQYGPEKVWFLYNHIYDCESGIAFASTSGMGFGDNAYIIGNVIHNIHPTTTWDPANSYEKAALMMWGGANRYIINNTIYDYSAGLYLAGNGFIKTENNIFANRTTSDGRDVFIDSGSNGVTNSTLFNNNIYTSPQRIQWGSGTIYTLTTFKTAFPTIGTGSISGDPQFINASAKNFRLLSTSPGKDAGLSSSVYATFQSLYGMSIAVDFEGTFRPQGMNWDIGAYEIKNDIKIPKAPLNINIK